MNNATYAQLGARWYEAQDDPVALLRAEARHRNPWVAEWIARTFGARPCSLLDIGCGAGFLSNDMAARGHRAVGIDAAPEALAVAARHDRTRTARYLPGDAQRLPFAAGTFDVVCAMDLLEHVDRPEQVIAEAARVLAPSGLFFFHTFNRNPLAWLVVIKGVEWFVKNTPRDMHVLDAFLKPSEVRAMCRSHGLEPREVNGSRPRFDRAMWRMLRTGAVPPELSFTFTRSTALAYTGVAQRIAARLD